MAAKIIPGPQVKDIILDILPYQPEEITIAEIRDKLSKFDCSATNVDLALRVLRNFKAIDCRWITMDCPTSASGRKTLKTFWRV